jgi:predicted MFS family arabinose efflux permease
METGLHAAETPQQKPASGRKRAGPMVFLLVMALGYAVYAADRTVLQSVITAMKPGLGLSDFQKGLLLSAQYMGVLAVVLFAGHLSDRFGKWRIILVGVVVFSVFTWLIAFAADFTQAFAFRVVSGVGEGIFWPVAMSAVANYFRKNKGLALGAFYVGFDAGGAGGSTIGGLSLSLTSGWRTAFFVAPLMGIAVVAGLFIARSAFSEADTKVGTLALGRDALALVKRKEILFIMLFAFMATYPIAVWQSYLTTYWNSVKGVDKAIAAYGYAAVLVSGAFGKVMLGRASDSWRRNRMLVTISAVSAALFALFFYTSSVYVGFALALAVGFVSSALFPIMQALASDSCDGKTGTALGLTTTFQSVATVLSPTITSVFFSQGAWKAIALNVLVPIILLILVALFLKDSKRAQKP